MVLCCGDESVYPFIKKLNSFNIDFNKLFFYVLPFGRSNDLSVQFGFGDSIDISSDTKISEVSERKLMSLSESFIDFRLTIVGSKGFDDAQITTGGLKLSSLNSDLSLKSNSCLYVCGEILNVDGPCGGYNLQWAWSSASCCADSILKRLS